MRRRLGSVVVLALVVVACVHGGRSSHKSLASNVQSYDGGSTGGSESFSSASASSPAWGTTPVTISPRPCPDGGAATSSSSPRLGSVFVGPPNAGSITLAGDVTGAGNATVVGHLANGGYLVANVATSPNTGIVQYLGNPSATTGPSLTISTADFIAASGAGGTTTLQAQNETGATSTGGALNLTSGTGTTAAGLTTLGVGGVSEWAVGPNGLAPGISAVTMATIGNTTLTQPQFQSPMISVNAVTLTGAVVLIFPNVVGMWWVDTSAVTFGANTIRFQCGTGVSAAVTPTASQQVSQVFCKGGNAVSFNL